MCVLTLSVREVAAVREWLGSGLWLHSMRDHPSHGFPLLGGMWGARLGPARGAVRRLWRGHWDSILQDNLTFADRWLKGPDQDLLRIHVWPWARHLALQHDSYTWVHVLIN